MEKNFFTEEFYNNTVVFLSEYCCINGQRLEIKPSNYNLIAVIVTFSDGTTGAIQGCDCDYDKLPERLPIEYPVIQF